VKIKAGKDALKGDLQLELPDNWKIVPKSIPFSIEKRVPNKSFILSNCSKKIEEATAKALQLIINVLIRTNYH
jgi:hypothetical protein